MCRTTRFALAAAALSLASCAREHGRPPLFQLLTPGRTGVTFANTITTNDSLNAQTDPYVYNGDRKSTRLNSSHSQISYAVFCLKKKKPFYAGSPKPLDRGARLWTLLCRGHGPRCPTLSAH